MHDYPFERSSLIHPAGTVLSFTVYGVIKHFGIATGYGSVIHASRRFGRVEETEFTVFCDGRRARIIPYASAISGSEIVARARTKLGQRYNILLNNCEHFMTWVTEGKARSSQLAARTDRCTSSV